MPSPQHEKPVA